MSESRRARIEGDGAVRRVVLESVLEAPIDVVWDALTHVDALARQHVGEQRVGAAIDMMIGTAA